MLDTARKKTYYAEQRRDAFQDLFRTFLHELMTAKTRVSDLEVTDKSSRATMAREAMV